MKHCPQCQQDKPHSDFFKNSRQYDGLSSLCKSCHTESVRTYRDKNRDKVNEWARDERAAKNEIRAANGWVSKTAKLPEEERKRRIKERKDKWRQSNLGRLAEWFRNYRKQNPEYYKNADRQKKARRKGAEGKFTKSEFDALCEQYGNICLRCKESKPLTPDHVIPIAKGGTNTIDNIQPLCLSCNCWKRARTIDYR